MIVLGIESAGPRGGVALLRGDGPPVERTYQSQGTLGADLAAMVEDVLAEAGLHEGAPDLIAVDTGPGSYTGLRIGIAAAKGLAFAWGRPLIGISALDALEAVAPASAGQVLCALDASRGQIHATLFARTARGPVRRIDGQLGKPLDLLAGVDGPALVVGDAFAAALDPARGLVAADPPLVWPSARDIARLARDRHLLGETHDAVQLKPIYYRRNEARVRTRQRSLRQA